MKLGVLFTGGKDSTLALFTASKIHEVVCLITIVSENKESYMFHTPNIELTRHQSECLGLPIIIQKTKGEKEKELIDLEKAIIKGIKQYNIEGIVTGAIASKYQMDRVKNICDKLKLQCINPLWDKNQIDILNELLQNNFDVIITAVGAYPFDETWLGKKLTQDLITELTSLQKKFGINPSFEGGEAETLVLNCPLFKKRLEILKAEKFMDSSHSGILKIIKIKLI